MPPSYLLGCAESNRGQRRHSLRRRCAAHAFTLRSLLRANSHRCAAHETCDAVIIVGRCSNIGPASLEEELHAGLDLPIDCFLGNVAQAEHDAQWQLAAHQTQKLVGGFDRVVEFQ